MPQISKTPQGWECPVCHIGVAPGIVTCPKCEKRTKEHIFGWVDIGVTAVTLNDLDDMLTEAGMGLPDEDTPTE